MHEDVPVITIDGPSGSGKGTLSRKLAEKLGWNFLDSGVLYRVLALVALQQNIPINDIESIKKLATNLEVKIINFPNEPQQIIYDNFDITDFIRQEGCGIYASQLAILPEVRNALLYSQRACCRLPGLVADGRDMGTVVFPDADVKFFFTATSEERAKRRCKQLQAKGINVSLAEVLHDLNERDMRDEKRALAPLKPADDAIIIDTTKLSIDEVLQNVFLRVELQLWGLS
jgi:CMP/dCMP kinase